MEDDVRRMVIEVADATNADLFELQQMQELNPTTLFNRGLRLYAELERERRAGGALFVRRPGGAVVAFRWE